MYIRRYEILLPLAYNDGSEIEKEKFDKTHCELVDKFGADTTDTVHTTGRWVYEGTLYIDKLLRIRLDVEDNEENRRFFGEYKEILKERFNQIDIWITAYTIEVI